MRATSATKVYTTMIINFFCKQPTVFFIVLCLCFIVPGSPHGQKTQSQYARLSVRSIPPGARIIINGIETGYSTPALIPNIPPGLNTVELILPDHLFIQRTVEFTADTTVNLSFKLISLSDTARIIGELQLGVLRLNKPPISNPYIIDNKQIYNQEITLNAGLHHVIWEGGNIFTSLDTIVEIFAGKISEIHFKPQRLYGKVTISPDPYDADIFINNSLYGTGEMTVSLPTGTYSVVLNSSKHYPAEKKILIAPDIHTIESITLTPIPDMDEDGFLDSLDKCPNQYGLYGGCPEQKKLDALIKYNTVFINNCKEQPLRIFVSLLSYMNRSPTNQIFSQFLSYFNNGTFLFTNVKGLSVANQLFFSYRGVITSIELGQWYFGLEYKKSRYNPLQLKTATNTYCVWYDTAAQVLPRITIPSTAISIGINLQISKFNLSNLFGYQFEDILVSDIITLKNKESYENGECGGPDGLYTGNKEQILFNNDWFFSAMYIDFEVLQFQKSILSFFTSCTIPISKHAFTGWYSIKFGFVQKFTLHP